jgi:nucleotide-binding universal stress UspA family protein
MRRFRRILYPSDFSSASAAAFRMAIDVAKTHRSKLMIAHVVHFPVAPGLPATLRAELRSLGEGEAEKKLERLVRSARSAGVTAAGLVLHGGAAPESIVEAVRRRRADLIVIGTHGRTGLRAVALGSVVARIVATAPCPVLTVRR